MYVLCIVTGFWSIITVFYFNELQAFGKYPSMWSHCDYLSLSLSLDIEIDGGVGGGGGEREYNKVQAYIYIYVQGNYIYIDIYCAGKWGEEWGKQVGSVTGESQVSNCYNFYLHQPGNGVCVGKDTSKQYI